MLAVLVAVAVCVVGLGALVDPARAFSVVTPDTGPIGDIVYGHRGGRAVHALTSLVEAHINGETDYLLGADLTHPVQYGIDYDEGDWESEAGVRGADLSKAARVLTHADWAHDRDATEITAVQAALWHFTDRFDLDRSAARNAGVVIERYQALVADAEAHPEDARPHGSLSVSPASAVVTGSEPAFVTVSGEATAPWSLELDDERSSVHPASADGVTCDTARTVTTIDAVPLAGASTVCITTTATAPREAIEVGLVVRSAPTWVNGGRIFRHAGRRSLVLASRSSTQSVATAEITSR